MGEVVSMFLFLPMETGEAGFNNVIARLNGAQLQSALRNMKAANISLKLPRLKLETSLGNELIDVSFFFFVCLFVCSFVS